MASSRVSLSMSEELRKTVKQLADKEDRSLSSMVTVMIKEGLRRRAPKRTKVRRVIKKQKIN